MKQPRKLKKALSVLAALLVFAMLLTACGAPGASESDPAAQANAAASVPSSSLPEPQPEPEPEPEPEPIVTTLRFSATGDNLIHNGLYLQAAQRAGGDGYDFGALYENIAPFYEDFDINWINAETLITDELPPSTYPCFCTPGAMGHELYDVGWRVIAMSNNHSYDMGATGIAATRRFWADMPDDVVTTGLFAGEEDYDNIPIQEIEDVRIAYLAYTYGTNGLPTPYDAEANVIYTTEEDVIEHQIKLAREQADVVVVGVHWGVEGSHILTDIPPYDQLNLGQKIADWGADVIIGTHPHVIQPVDVLTSEDGRSVPIAYSLGNFVSLQSDADNLIGLIFTFTITKTTQPDGTSETVIDEPAVVPMVMHYDAGYANGRAYLYRDYTEELAAAHGVRARWPSFSKEYIMQVLTEYIDPEYLVLE